MILIVDDKSENIFALQKLLEVNNFDVDTALSGEEALKKVLKNDYELIILDVQMPGMDGFEVAETLSGFSKARDIPIIFLSAVNTDKKFITRGYVSGGIDYVSKPVDPDILLLKIKTFHRLYEQASALRKTQSELQLEIEARKRAQYEQTRKTHELQTVLESIPQIAFTANATGNIEYVNEQWYLYSDHKNSFPAIFSDNIPVSGFWPNIIDSARAQSVEVCVKELNRDDYRYQLLNLMPIKEGQKVVRWVGTFTDIHEQRLSKDILEKKVEARTAELVVANKELAFQNREKEKRAAELIVANKELIYQNEEKQKRADELIIANLQLAAQSKEKERKADELIVAYLQLAAQSKEKEKRAAELVVANKELAFQNDEKENRAAELIIANKELSFQNDEKEKRAGELKVADAERLKMMADIVRRNKNLEQFSYIISHNLRAPVANILGLTNVIQTIELDKEEGKKISNFLVTAAQNLDKVIRDINYILEFKHEVSEKKECVKFSELINEVKISIGNVIYDEDVQIITDFSEADEIVTIKSYLYSIFFNLISNSIKYRQNGIAPFIKVTSSKANNTIRLSFKDNGLGIDVKKNGADVFGLYKRFHDHVEGKGMGLYMVKTQLETLGGVITVESEVNKGAEFMLEFETTR